ncbi:MAG: hypothetical protein NVS1B5_14520 [Gemmatimonadaceae bacterium]
MLGFDRAEVPLDQLKEHDEERGIRRKCGFCDALLGLRSHTIGECMLILNLRGRTLEFIARVHNVTIGLAAETIERERRK